MGRCLTLALQPTQNAAFRRNGLKRNVWLFIVHLFLALLFGRFASARFSTVPAVQQAIATKSAALQFSLEKILSELGQHRHEGADKRLAECRHKAVAPRAAGALLHRRLLFLGLDRFFRARLRALLQ